MSATAKWFCASLLLIGPAAWAQTPETASAPEWAISSSPARFVVEPDQPAKPAALCGVSFSVPDPKWLNLPIRVFADNGAPVGSDLVWTAPGEPATLLFDSSSGSKRYHVYLGSSWPAMHLDAPKSGVILESRAGITSDYVGTGLLLESKPDTTPPSPGSSPDAIRVFGATYGTGSIQRDMTEIIKAKVAKGLVTFPASGEETGGDPLAGVPKDVYIRYSLNGTIYGESFWERRDTVSLRETKRINSLSNMLQEWNQSKVVNGRALVGGIFEGGNRFGTQDKDVLEYFRGWFDVAAPEHLQLAAISYFPTYLLVDGRPVDRAIFDGEVPTGPEGQFVGAVDLAPGTHLLECYLAYRGSAPYYSPLMCCVAAKGGPLQTWTSLTAESNFFRPCGSAHVTDYQLQSGGDASPGGARPPPFAIEWVVNSQSLLSPNIADIGLISMQLTCRSARNGTVTWTFDDGTTAQGAVVQHLFLRPGMRTVRVSVKDGANSPDTLVQTISVHPNWQLMLKQPPQLVPEHLAAVLACDPAAFPAADLAGCMAVLGSFKSTDGLLKVIPAVGARMKEIDEADLPSIQAAGVYLAMGDRLHFTEAGQLFKALVDRCSTAQPSPLLAKVGSEARLYLAYVLLTTSEQAADAKPLLDGINVQGLTAEEHRIDDILWADLALAAGDVAGARKQYQKLASGSFAADARSSIRLTAIIDHVRAYIGQKDYASAEDALGQVSWSVPSEKMSPDWALLRLRLYQEEGLAGPGYCWAVRLLPVIADSGRSELLFRLADLAFAQGHDDVGKKALSELLRKYPYTEEAAQAKGKWPGKS